MLFIFEISKISKRIALHRTRVIILEVALNVEIHSVISQWGDGRNVMFLNGKKMPKNGKAQTCKKMQNAKRCKMQINTKKCKKAKKMQKDAKKMQTSKKDAKMQRCKSYRKEEHGEINWKRSTPKLRHRGMTCVYRNGENLG